MLTFVVLIQIFVVSLEMDQQISSLNFTFSTGDEQKQEIKLGLICNYSGQLGLETSAGAISIAFEKLNAEGYLRERKFRWAEMPCNSLEKDGWISPESWKEDDGKRKENY